MSERVLLSHGGGGRATRDLIENELKSRFQLGALPDAASVSLSGGRVLFTTDGFVVSPSVFPGGDIGKLAVCGTVNDLAVSGGRPKYLACSLILEEGLEFDLLRRILDSIASTADECGVQIVTGDTKVVPRGQCDKIYITTTGIGEAIESFRLGAGRLELSDEILVSGGLGEHGLAIMAARGEAPLGVPLESDVGSVHRLVACLEDLGLSVKFMRDPTRGGLAMVCHELVDRAPHGIELRESSIPVSPKYAAFAEMTGIDVLHLASEGRLVLVCAQGAGEKIVERWWSLPEGKSASCIGRVTSKAGRVTMATVSGGVRLVDVPEGELLPRIC